MSSHIPFATTTMWPDFSVFPENLESLSWVFILFFKFFSHSFHNFFPKIFKFLHIFSAISSSKFSTKHFHNSFHKKIQHLHDIFHQFFLRLVQICIFNLKIIWSYLYIPFATLLGVNGMFKIKYRMWWTLKNCLPYSGVMYAIILAAVILCWVSIKIS